MAKLGKLMAEADAFAPLPTPPSSIPCRYDIYQSVWREAAELRRSGQLLKLAKDIRCPVAAICGSYDSHASLGISEPLFRVLKDFRFFSLDKCGHSPWLGKFAREEFYNILKSLID